MYVYEHFEKKNYSSMEAPCDCDVGITRPSLPSLFFLKHSMVSEYTDSNLDIQIVVEGVNFLFFYIRQLSAKCPRERRR
jgi:hypothetical protein